MQKNKIWLIIILKYGTFDFDQYITLATPWQKPWAVYHFGAVVDKNNLLLL